MRHESLVSEMQLGNALFGDAYAHTQSNHRTAMFDATQNLVDFGLIEEDKFRRFRITNNARPVEENPHPYWQQICAYKLDEDEERLLRFVNQSSPVVETVVPCVWLKDVDASQIKKEFRFDTPPETDEDRELASKFISSVPKFLADSGLIRQSPRMGYNNNLKATYRGIVWEKARGLTIDALHIRDLVNEWETTNVDFKRELSLDTKDKKCEFAKDVLGLANTKSSGRRFMIVGFDDKTRSYYGPPDSKVTQERIEQLLSGLTEPVVLVRYEVIDHTEGKVGRLEVMREPFKLPYRAKVDLSGEKKRLKKDAVYVRHGTITRELSDGDEELRLLQEEGARTRGENTV